MKLRTWSLLATFALACAWACGGSSNNGGGGGSSTVNGNLGGGAMSAKDAISATGPLLGSGGPIGLVVLVTDVSGTCSAAAANAKIKNAKAIALFMTDTGADGGSTAVAAGTYPVYSLTDPNYPTGKTTFGFTDVYDGTCKDSSSGFVTGGNVVVTAVSASGASGTFDVTNQAGNHLTGSFQTSSCTGLVSGAASDGGTSACQ